MNSVLASKVKLKSRLPSPGYFGSFRISDSINHHGVSKIMLNEQERHDVLVSTKYLYAVCLFPCKIDLKTFKIDPRCTTKWTTLLLKVLYVLHLAHCAFKIASLAINLLSSERLPLHQAMLHAGLAGASALYTFWYYLLHVKYSDINSDFVTMTLKGDHAEGKASKQIVRVNIYYI